MTIGQIVWSLARKDFVLWGSILSASLLAWTLFAPNPIAAYALFVLLFTCFDCYGFALTASRDADVSENRIKYRVIQNMMMVALLAFEFKVFGAWQVVACVAAWWLTACDFLFYILGRKTFYDDYSKEFGWSAIFWIPNRRKWHFWLSAGIGFFGGLAISYFLK